MICGKCGEKINTQYGYIRTNGYVYHNGVCPSSLLTVAACSNESCVITGDLPNGYYVMIPSAEHQQLKNTIEANQTQIIHLQAQLEVAKVAMRNLLVAEPEMSLIYWDEESKRGKEYAKAIEAADAALEAMEGE